MVEQCERNVMTPAQFRDIMSAVPNAVTIVATAGPDGRPHGLTAIAFCGVSLDPPLCLVCVDKRSRTLAALTAAEQFTVNILDEQQQALAERFATKAAEKFSGVDWTAGPATGQPVLAACAAYVECRLWQMVDAGDHWVVLGLVESGAVDGDAGALVYWRRGFRQLARLYGRNENGP